MSVVVIDIGHSTLKSSVVGSDGSITSIIQTDNHWINDDPYPHADIDMIQRWIINNLKEHSQQHQIKSIIVSSHGAAAAVIGEDELVLPVVDYEFDGYDELNVEYESIARDYSTTFSPRLPKGLNLGRQLFWLQKKYQKEFQGCSYILTYPQFWSWILSGNAALEVTSLGCHTDLWEPLAKRYSKLVIKLKWDLKFPPIKPAWYPTGMIKSEIASTTGLPYDCRVINGIHDSNAAYLCHRLGRNEPFVVISTGTWFICMASGGSLKGLDEKNDMLANVDVFGNPVPTIRFMGGHEFRIISGLKNIKSEIDLNDLQEIIDKKIFAMPSFAKTGGPYLGHAGKIRGQMDNNPQMRTALATLYCALITDDCLARLRATGDIFIEGRFAMNSLYCGLIATLRNPQNTFRSTEQTGSVAGAYMLSNWSGNQQKITKDLPIPYLELNNLEDYKMQWIDGLKN